MRALLCEVDGGSRVSCSPMNGCLS